MTSFFAHIHEEQEEPPTKRILCQSTELEVEPDEILCNEIADGYQKDKYFAKVLSHLKDESSPLHARFTMNTNTRLLEYHDTYSPCDNERVRICLPGKALPARLLTQIHQQLGHCGERALYQAAKQRFYVSHMRKTINDIVSHCDACQRAKISRMRKANLLPLRDLPVRPWTHVSVDFCGPTQPSEKTGNDFLMISIDVLTKHCRISTLKFDCSDAKTCAKLFVADVVRTYGVPSRVITDRDVRFSSLFMRTVYELCGIKAIRTSPYHPEGNSVSERAHAVLWESIRGAHEGNPSQWEDLIPAVEAAFNSTFKTPTGFTPRELLFGFPQRLPSDAILPPPQSGDPPQMVEASEFVARHRELYEMAREACRRAQDVICFRENVAGNTPQFEVGQRVLVKRTRFTPPDDRGQSHRKILSQYVGPYVILERRGTLTYRLQLPPGSKYHPVFHVNDLRQYLDPHAVGAQAPLPLRLPRSQLTGTPTLNATPSAQPSSTTSKVTNDQQSQPDTPPPQTATPSTQGTSAQPTTTSSTESTQPKPRTSIPPTSLQTSTTTQNGDPHSIDPHLQRVNVSQHSALIDEHAVQLPADTSVHVDHNLDCHATHLPPVPSPHTNVASPETYEVDKILKWKRDKRGKPMLQVKWRGYQSPTWEPLDNMRVGRLPSRALLTFMASRPRLHQEVNRWLNKCSKEINQ